MVAHRIEQVAAIEPDEIEELRGVGVTQRREAARDVRVVERALGTAVVASFDPGA